MNNIQGIFTITENNKIAKDVYRMRLVGEAARFISQPGQFVSIKLTEGMDPFLRRPMSIHDYDEKSIVIIYKVVGIGTKMLAQMVNGETLDLLVGLGNGFPFTNSNNILLVGGGVGVPPLYNLAKQLKSQGKSITTVLGFNGYEDVFCEAEFKEFGEVYVATMDGSYGTKGNVIDVIKNNNLVFDEYYSCGPERMLDALITNYPDNGWLSFESRMACGIGACMGCSCKVKTAPYKRICVEGPVLHSSEVIVHE